MGIDRHNPDVPVSAVMNEILGGGFASRLFQKVRTELGLAYEVRAASPSPMTIQAPSAPSCSPRAPSTVDATKAALAEIAGLNTTPFTEEELAAPKTTSSTHSSSATTPKTRSSPNVSGWSSTATRQTTLRPTRPLSKKLPWPIWRACQEVHSPRQAGHSGGGQRPGDQAGLEDLKMGPIHPIDITIPMPKQPQGAEKQ
jgi:zinc protease